MEFWGVEVKSGEPLKVQLSDEKILHLSQATLGEVKKDKGNESIPLFVKIGGQKLVLGTLSSEKCTHIPFDLVFEKDFELSHNGKNGSVYFCGYKSVIPDEADDFTDSEFEEDHPLSAAENGKSEKKDKQAKPALEKVNAAKPDSSAAKPKVKIVEPNKDDKSKDDGEDDESDNDEDYEDSEEDDSDDEDMLDAGDESDDDESSDEEDEETPKKAELGKKRPSESASKTPAPEKKAKLVTPQKTGGKKGSGHTATPHPAKQVEKTPAKSDKSKVQTPKSGGSVSCKSCSKTFNSDGALQSHTKAKHSGGK